MRMNEYDCFFSYNSADRAVVEQIARRIEAVGLQVLLDSRALPPGERVVPWLETAIQSAACVAVFWGASGKGHWHEFEMDLALDRERHGDLRVIPVLLPAASSPPDLPGRLSGYSFVDLRGGVSDFGLQRLIRGIKGEGATVGQGVALDEKPGPLPEGGGGEQLRSRHSGSTPGDNEVEGLVENTKADQVNIIGSDGEAQAGRNLVKARVEKSDVRILNIIGNRNNRTPP